MIYDKREMYLKFRGMNLNATRAFACVILVTKCLPAFAADEKTLQAIATGARRWSDYEASTATVKIRAS